MKIGIIGAGNVGGTLGKRWAAAGHTVVYGIRNPDRALGQRTVAEAVEGSEIAVLATPWEVAGDAIQSAGSAALEGKVLVDATNPLLPQLAGLALGTTTSAAEQIAQWAPRSRVVKAFNSVGANIMANPQFDSRKVAMFYCGDDAEAKAQVKQLAADLGFEPLDAGPLTQARVIEPFAMLWISLAYVAGFGREIGFEFLRR